MAKATSTSRRVVVRDDRGRMLGLAVRHTLGWEAIWRVVEADGSTNVRWEFFRNMRAAIGHVHAQPFVPGVL